MSHMSDCHDYPFWKAREFFEMFFLQVKIRYLRQFLFKILQQLNDYCENDLV